MTTTITAVTSEDTTTPIAVDGYETSRQSQNIIHDLISGGIAVTLIAPRPRAGRLELIYDNETDAFAALNLHAEETVFTIARDDITAIGMSYVVDGSVDLEVDQTRTMWRASVGYQEATT